MDFQFKTPCYELSLKANDCCGTTSSNPVNEAYDPHNAENPYDEAGIVHNKILEVMAEKRASFMNDLPKATEIALDYLQSHPFQTKAMASQGKLTQELRDQITALCWPGGCIPEIWPPIRLPFPFPFPLGDGWLNDVIWGLIRKGYSVEFTGQTLSSFKSEIMTAERQILSREMEQTYKVSALCALSVFRHSIAYWQGQTSAKRGGIGEWIISGIADVSGGLIGFGLSLGNPLGVVAGAATISGIVDGAQSKK